MNCKPITKVEAGRKTAALRVRQRQKRESLRWSPSGKLRTPHTRRSPTIEHTIPWNDRFIFKDEIQSDKATHSTDRRISRRKCDDEKENVENLKSCSNRIHHYTERCDGDAVRYFQQIEILTSSGAADGVQQRPSAVETRSIALSPFDMEKVKAALEANSSTDPKTPHEVECILDQFEELILTMEMEEEVVRRDLELEKMKKKDDTLCEGISLEREEVEGKTDRKADLK